MPLTPAAPSSGPSTCSPAGRGSTSSSTPASTADPSLPPVSRSSAPGSGVDALALRLATAGCVAAREEAQALLAAADDARALEAMVRRREDGEPLAWITG